MNIKKIRKYFPQLKNVIYLNTGSSGPTPTPVMEEMKRYLRLAELEGQASPLLYKETMKLNLRQKAADLLKVSEEEISFTQSTSHGLGIIFSGLDWKEDDEIIVAHPEYISGMLNCQNIAERYGVKLKIIDTDKTGYIQEEKIINAMNDRTKLILLSHVNFHNGQRLTIDKICKASLSKNKLILIDGAQSVGAIEVNIKKNNPDFYVFPSQKWLLGEEGMGILYIKKDSLPHIKVSHMGYNSVEKFSPYGFTLHPGARRFEAATPSYASYFAFSGAIDFYNMIGEDVIFSRIEKLTTCLKEKLAEIKGINLLTPDNYTEAGGLVSFIIDGIDYQEVAKELYKNKKIIIRSIPLPECLRVSAHYFNTEEEMDIVVEEIKKYIKS